MKKLFLAAIFAVLTAGGAAHANPIIDTQIVAVFKVHFPNARNVSWNELADSYDVYFVDNGIQQRISYRKDESTVSIFRYYTNENLPYDLYFVLNKQMPGKKVFAATELSQISQPGSIVSKEYTLTLEDDDRWYIIKMHTDGTMNVIKKYKKA